MGKTSICIVTHNNEKEILKLLKSIYEFTKNINFKVYIVDNNSSDNTASLIKENYKEVTLIESKVNLGFGRAHNLVLGKVNSVFHVILNPDIVLCSNAIGKLITYLKNNPGVTLATPKIVYPNGQVQMLPKKDPKLKYMLAGKLEKYSKYFSDIRKEYTMQGKEEKQPFSIDFCSGCFMMIRTEVFKKLGGFDERFFMYLEDADLSRRARKYGKIMFVPDVKVIHTWHRESSKNIKFLLIHIISMFKYFKKWKKY